MAFIHSSVGLEKSASAAKRPARRTRKRKSSMKRRIGIEQGSLIVSATVAMKRCSGSVSVTSFFPNEKLSHRRKKSMTSKWNTQGRKIEWKFSALSGETFFHLNSLTLWKFSPSDDMMMLLKIKKSRNHWLREQRFLENRNSDDSVRFPKKFVPKKLFIHGHLVRDMRNYFDVVYATEFFNLGWEHSPAIR